MHAGDGVSTSAISPSLSPPLLNCSGTELEAVIGLIQQEVQANKPSACCLYHSLSSWARWRARIRVLNSHGTCPPRRRLRHRQDTDAHGEMGRQERGPICRGTVPPPPPGPEGEKPLKKALSKTKAGHNKTPRAAATPLLDQTLLDCPLFRRSQRQNMYAGVEEKMTR